MSMLRASIRRLEVFATVAETGSFAAAAERLDISQPSVSSHIAALERSVGGELFLRRRGTRPLLTELGTSVLSHAREMLAEARSLSEDAMSIHAGGEQRVIVSCQRSLANYALNRGLVEYALARPEVQLVVRIGRQEEVLGDMREARSDIGCMMSNDDHRGVVTERIGSHRLCFVASPDHPLANVRQISAARLAREAFVGPPAESLFGQSLYRQFAAAGLPTIRTVARATEYQFLMELVAARVGIACSPSSSVQGDVQRGRLVSLDVAVPPMEIGICLVHPQGRPRTAAAEELYSYLRTAIQPTAQR